MSRRSVLWRRKLGHPPLINKVGKETGRGSQCGGDMAKLQATKPSNMVKSIPVKQK